MLTIPMRDTPIYAQLKAEHEEQEARHMMRPFKDATAFVASRKPLLKNRKTRR